MPIQDPTTDSSRPDFSPSDDFSDTHLNTFDSIDRIDDPATPSPRFGLHSDAFDSPMSERESEKPIADATVKDRSQRSIQTWLKQDISATQDVPTANFLEAIHGIKPEKLDAWTAAIVERRWCDDEKILKALRQSSHALTEKSTYAPLTALIARIIELALEARKSAANPFPGLPSKFPVNDILTMANYPVPVQKIGDEYRLQALRKPGLLTFRAMFGDFLKKHGEEKACGLLWSMVILSWEVKFVQTIVSTLYEAFCPGEPSTCKVWRQSQRTQVGRSRRPCTIYVRYLRVYPIIRNCIQLVLCRHEAFHR